MLDAYLAAAGAAGDASAARYLLASALDDLGETQGALDSYERYITAGGAAADFARVERAKLLARLGRSADAVTAAELVLASSLLPEFKASFTLSMGKAFEQGKDDADALAWYGRAKTIDGGDVASASARIGAIKKRLGDATWSGEYTQAVVSYPSSGVAPDLLDELDAAGIVVSDYARGVVEYRAFRNADARAALARAAASGDNAAEATYYLGALDERAGDNAAAIEDYRRAHELNPASTLADDALWWRGRLLERAGRFSEAGDVYGALVADYPASSWRGDADFRRGLALYRAQNYAGAALAWSVIAATAGGDDALRALLAGACAPGVARSAGRCGAVAARVGSGRARRFLRATRGGAARRERTEREDGRATGRERRLEQDRALPQRSHRYRPPGNRDARGR